MDKKESIEQLKNILTSLPLTTEQKAAVEFSIRKLKNSDTKETLIEVAKIIAALLGGGS